MGERETDSENDWGDWTSVGNQRDQSRSEARGWQGGRDWWSQGSLGSRDWWSQGSDSGSAARPAATAAPSSSASARPPAAVSRSVGSAEQPPTSLHSAEQAEWKISASLHQVEVPKNKQTHTRQMLSLIHI